MAESIDEGLSLLWDLFPDRDVDDLRAAFLENDCSIGLTIGAVLETAEGGSMSDFMSDTVLSERLEDPVAFLLMLFPELDIETIEAFLVAHDATGMADAERLHELARQLMQSHDSMAKHPPSPRGKRNEDCLTLTLDAFRGILEEPAQSEWSKKPARAEWSAPVGTKSRKQPLKICAPLTESAPSTGHFRFSCMMRVHGGSCSWWC